MAKREKKEFTRNAVEAALCLWEQALQWMPNQPAERLAALSDEVRATLQALDGRRNYGGSGQLRMDCADLGQACSDTYFRLSEDIRDIIVFDWEYVPAFFLLGIDWENAMPHPDALERVAPHMQAILDRGDAAGRAMRAGIERDNLAGFVSLETSGCFKPDDSSIAQCADESATFWTVYGRGRDGLAQAIIDCPSRSTADSMAAYLGNLAKIPVH